MLAQGEREVGRAIRVAMIDPSCRSGVSVQHSTCGRVGRSGLLPARKIERKVPVTLHNSPDVTPASSLTNGVDLGRSHGERAVWGTALHSGTAPAGSRSGDRVAVLQPQRADRAGLASETPPAHRFDADRCAGQRVTA